jgi:hypothetical protein
MQSSQQQRALSFEQFVGLLERKSVIPGVLSVQEASNFHICMLLLAQLQHTVFF